MFSLTPVVRVLLLANVAVLLLQRADFITTDLFALHAFASPLFQPWQLVTYMFMHGDFWHLFSNSLSLLIFGALLEQHWGGRRFLTFYLVCGLGAGLLYNGIREVEMRQIRTTAEQFVGTPDYIGFDRFTDAYGGGRSSDYAPITQALKTDPTNAAYREAAVRIVTEIAGYIITFSSMLGASGAVFGILFAFGYLFPNTELYLYFAIPIKAKYFVFLYGAYELYNGVHRTAGDNVAHFAHLSGMLIAFILLKYWEKRHPDFY